MRPDARRSTRLATAFALSVLVVGAMASPAAAHAEELAEPGPGGLTHLLTQWDHVAMIVAAVVAVGAIVAMVRSARNQAD